MKSASGSQADEVLAKTVLLILWGLGIGEALHCGFHPSKVAVVSGIFTYPVLEVMVECVVITLQAAMLYAILRPFGSEGRSRRLIWAVPVCCGFCYSDFDLIGMGRDVQPDSIGPFATCLFFVTLTVGLIALICRYWPRKVVH